MLFANKLSQEILMADKTFCTILFCFWITAETSPPYEFYKRIY